MSIKRAKPIDRLYEEVADQDLVVVPDAPLASALNRRLERAHFGPFAITPRRLAARRRETAEDRLAFLEVIDRTDIGWKTAATAVGNILQCWEYEGRSDAILDYDAFDTPATRAAVGCIESLETTSQQLTDYTIETEDYRSVAVVGERQLTELERSILPETYKSVDPFIDEPFDPTPFRIFDSPAAIVDTLLETITEETAEDIAVVLDAGSEYSTLVESAFESRGVPFFGGPGFSDDPDHRCFLELLRTVYGGTDTRVGDVRPLLSHLDVEVPVDHDEKRLSEVGDPNLEWLREFCETSPNEPIAGALETYEQRIDRPLKAFREELDRLGVANEPLTENLVNRLSFYVQTYEVPIDRENTGVLLADAKSAAFVDRPVVFYLGLDESWTHSAPQRPWVDRNEEFERNINQFQYLLQNGVERHYLVQDVAGGSPVSPCLYFEELLEEEFERFSDLESIKHTRTVRSVKAGFEQEPIDVEAETIKTVSQSSLNTYANCPRDYFFGQLVDSPDRHYFEEGNLFHDFAEFYVNHPDAVDEDVLDELADVMADEMRSFHRTVNLATRRTAYRGGLTTIVDYLDAHGPSGHDFLTADGGWGTNFFAEYFDRPIDSPITERWFEDNELGLKGKIDLIQDPQRLLDFKSGSKKSASQVTKNSALESPSDTPNFQALLYLTYYRTQRPGERLQFTFFHFLETLDDFVAGEPEIEDCLTTITYRPVPYQEFIATRKTFDALCEDAPNDCKKTFSKATYDDYIDVIDGSRILKTRDGNELADSTFGDRLTARMQAVVGDYKYVTNGCVQACRYLAGLRTENYFVDDLDAFERFVDDRIEDLNRCRSGEERFPVEGLAGEPNYRYVDNRDLILTDD